MTTAIEVAPRLREVITTNKVSEADARALIETFQPIFADMAPLLKQAADLEVTDAGQVGRMKQAGKIRKALKEVRCRAENVRKAMNEDGLRKSRAINGVAAIVKGLIEPAETRMEEAETFAERLEKARIDALRADRQAQIRAIGGDPAVLADLGTMPDDAWEFCLEHAREVAERKQTEAAKAEEDRLEREAAAAKDRARLVLEREAAQAREAEERAGRMKAEREAQEARAAAARAEREAREAAAKAKAQADAEEAERARAAAAPDREKIRAYLKALYDVPRPECSSEAGTALVNTIASEVRFLIQQGVKRAEALSAPAEVAASS